MSTKLTHLTNNIEENFKELEKIISGRQRKSDVLNLKFYSLFSSISQKLSKTLSNGEIEEQKRLYSCIEEMLGNIYSRTSLPEKMLRKANNHIRKLETELSSSKQEQIISPLEPIEKPTEGSNSTDIIPRAVEKKDITPIVEKSDKSPSENPTFMELKEKKTHNEETKNDLKDKIEQEEVLKETIQYTIFLGNGGNCFT
jgi:hypothetical protein